MPLPFRKVFLLLLVLPVFFAGCSFIEGGGTPSSPPQSEYIR
jgi:hypothetical protein